MAQFIDKATLVEKINKRIQDASIDCYGHQRVWAYNDIKSIIDTLEVKESDETAEAFARIIRANLTGIDKDVQYKFEQLYKKITGEKMYQGYKD